MTNPESLNLLDTDYAALIATDYDPNLERLMRAAEESPTDTVVLTRLLGLAQKLLETEEDWQELEEVWGKLERNERADRPSQTVTPNSYPNRLQLYSNPASSSSACNDS